MFERFTDRARKIMALANQEAQRFKHEYIGTEHILIGLVKEGRGVAATVLKSMNADVNKLRLEVEKHTKPGPEMVAMGKLPYTPAVKNLIEYSMEEARSLNHNYVGTEHLLLGLLREQDNTGAQVLINLGFNLEAIRGEVLNLLGVETSIAVPLTLLIDPGNASAEELSEVFVELSVLYRIAGGSGVNFTIVDAKETVTA